MVASSYAFELDKSVHVTSVSANKDKRIAVRKALKKSFQDRFVSLHLHQGCCHRNRGFCCATSFSHATDTTPARTSGSSPSCDSKRINGCLLRKGVVIYMFQARESSCCALQPPGMSPLCSARTGAATGGRRVCDKECAARATCSLRCACLARASWQGAMNLFRIIADLLHVASLVILLRKIRTKNSVAGARRRDSVTVSNSSLAQASLGNLRNSSL